MIGSVDGVGAADHHRGLVLPSQHPQGVGQQIEFLAQQLDRGLHLQGHTGVEDIGAGHPHVDVATGVTHVLVDVGEEGDHVMAHLSLDLEDPLDAEAGFVFDRGDGFGRDAAQFAVGFSGGNLHVQPALELRLLAPDGAHLGQGVTLDQGQQALQGGARFAGVLPGQLPAQLQGSHDEQQDPGRDAEAQGAKDQQLPLQEA